MSTLISAGTSTSGAVINSDTSGSLQLQTGSTPTTAVTIDTSQRVGIGTTSPSYLLDISSGAVGASTLRIATTTASYGANLILQGTTTSKNWSVSSSFTNAGDLAFVPSTTNGGVTFTTAAMALDNSGNLNMSGGGYVGNQSNSSGIYFGSNCVLPSTGTALSDNSKSMGNASWRWSVIYAGTGTINTSDANQKQDIAVLDDAEKRVAVAIKSLIKKYRFKDAVAKKGDAARIHVGAVAQEVAAAFVAQGLDPTRYSIFCSDTWYEVDGKTSEDLTNPYTAKTEGAVEVTQLGLRYDELFAFVIAAL